MDLSNVLKVIKKSFTPRKNVDFDEQGLHFELEPLTSIEETKVLESLKDVDETHYIENLRRYSLACSIRKITVKEDDKVTEFDLSKEFIEYADLDGSTKKKSKFLYMIDYLGTWPDAIIDALFDAHTQMHEELDDRVNKSVKFEKILLSDKVPEDKPDTFRPLNETEVPEGELDDAERQQRKVDKEMAAESERMAQAELNKFQKMSA
jgi:hypothetical protein